MSNIGDIFMAENKSSQAGNSCTALKLWEGKSSADRLIWLTEPPEIESEETSKAEDPEYAITLLHRDINKSGKQTLDTIIMRGPELRNFLEQNIPKISSHYKEAEQGIAIRSPFRQLFWHLDHIHAATQGREKKLCEVTTLLYNVLIDEFQDLLALRRELLAGEEINFEILWTLFKPGMTCVYKHGGAILAVKVSSIDFIHDSMGNRYYRISYTDLRWDGEYLGWQDSHQDILEFGGRRKIKDLDIFPIEFSQDSQMIDKLTTRGRTFVGLALKEPYMMISKGETLDRENSPMWWQGEEKKKISERVVLDARAYNHTHRRLVVSKLMSREQLNRIFNTDHADEAIFLYCCTEFHCFALQRKKWATIWMDDLDKVVFNELAYPSLVLPKDYKELLLAFAEAQIRGYGFDDVIAGKGQGILMLLAGPPGTGKTLTAEAMAEHMRRPLYSVSAGELGAAVSGMEHELDRILELTTRWNAVLLLDEADVFLERRTDNDIQRNTVVSVFLRKLEYYRGIMFLTTNRIGSFDEAFKSRIHVAIRYPDLDANARRVIWENFLAKIKDIYEHGVDVSAKDLDQLSQKPLNGREIRNIVKSAQLLASRSQSSLQKSFLETVWQVEHENSPWH